MKHGKSDHDKQRLSSRSARGRRTWRRKFADAFSGIRQSVRRQSSFAVHVAAAALVVLAAFLLGNFDAVRWSLLILCIAAVIGAEMFNTALEMLARAVTSAYNPFVGRALNIASAAVLTLAAGAAGVGLLLFAESLWRLTSPS